MSNKNNNDNNQLVNEVNDAKSLLGEIRMNIAGMRANLGMVVGMVDALAVSMDSIRGATDRVASANT